MDFRTENWSELLQPGERLRKVREMRGLSREQLVELVELLPENGEKTRSAKQVDYIERGVRPMSPNYARLLAKALKVRVEFLLGEDDFITENDRIASIAGQQSNSASLIQNLLALHGFLVADATEQQPIKTDTQGRKYQEKCYVLVSPSGSRRFYTGDELTAFFQQIDDYTEMLAAFQFRRLEDKGTNKFDWRV